MKLHTMRQEACGIQARLCLATSEALLLIPALPLSKLFNRLQMPSSEAQLNSQDTLLAVLLVALPVLNPVPELSLLVSLAQWLAELHPTPS